jgi:hypothetical protein
LPKSFLQTALLAVLLKVSNAALRLSVPTATTDHTEVTHHIAENGQTDLTNLVLGQKVRILRRFAAGQ